jgi:pimeloyl-ACP methyl ester carboxylesterase
MSIGSAIAQEVALSHPGMAKSLILGSTWNYCDVFTTRIFRTFRRLVATTDRGTFNRVLQLWNFSPQYYSENPNTDIQMETSISNNLPVHVFQAHFDACISHNTRLRLKQIKVPVLITTGDRDTCIPLYYSQSIAEEIPNAKLLVFEGVGHQHHIERFGDFIQETLDFLNDIRDVKKVRI